MHISEYLLLFFSPHLLLTYDSSRLFCVLYVEIGFSVDVVKERKRETGEREGEEKKTALVILEI